LTALEALVAVAVERRETNAVTVVVGSDDRVGERRRIRVGVCEKPDR
jgi:hypothetical protein